jgi:hypothetical protein
MPLADPCLPAGRTLQCVCNGMYKDCSNYAERHHGQLAHGFADL